MARHCDVSSDTPSRYRKFAANCLGETRWGPPMERTVVWRKRLRRLPHVEGCAEGGGRKRMSENSDSEPMPASRRLRELGSGRGFERWRGCRRRRHAGVRGDCKAGMADQDQQEYEARYSGDRPRETAPATHEDELNRISRRQTWMTTVTRHSPKELQESKRERTTRTAILAFKIGETSYHSARPFPANRLDNGQETRMAPAITCGHARPC